MHIILNPRDAARVLQTAARHAPHRSTVPYLSGVLLTTGEESVTVRATDLETDVRISMPANVSQPGKCLVPAKLLMEIMASLEGEEANLKATEAELHISSGSARFALACMDPSDFPAPLGAEPGVVLQADAGALRGALSRVLHAAGRDETRPSLKGVRLVLSGATLQLAATDGARLATVTVPVIVSDPPDAQAAVTLPSAGAAAIAHEMPGQTVRIGVASEVATAESDDLVLATRLVPGSYPEFSQVIQKSLQNPTQVHAPTQELVRATELALITARSEGRLVYLHISPEGVRLESSTQEVGQTTIPIPNATCPETTVRIALNGLYFLQALRAVRDEATSLLVKDPLSPILVRGASGTDTYAEVLAPLRAYGT
jgi:DNA polymerase-3 subunit beta